MKSILSRFSRIFESTLSCEEPDGSAQFSSVYGPRVCCSLRLSPGLANCSLSSSVDVSLLELTPNYGIICVKRDLIGGVSVQIFVLLCKVDGYFISLGANGSWDPGQGSLIIFTQIFNACKVSQTTQESVVRFRSAFIILFWLWNLRTSASRAGPMAAHPILPPVHLSV